MVKLRNALIVVNYFEMRKRKIKLKCNSCENEKLITRTTDIPNNAFVVVSNYCTRKKCEKKHEGDYWREWFETKEGNEILDT